MKDKYIESFKAIERTLGYNCNKELSDIYELITLYQSVKNENKVLNINIDGLFKTNDFLNKQLNLLKYTPTEEKIKKEWEDEGFEIISFTKERIEIYKQWIERKNNCSHHTSAKIVIEKDFFYIVGQFSNKYIQLLTKTFKMLGWK